MYVWALITGSKKLLHFLCATVYKIFCNGICWYKPDICSKENYKDELIEKDVSRYFTRKFYRQPLLFLCCAHLIQCLRSANIPSQLTTNVTIITQLLSLHTTWCRMAVHLMSVLFESHRETIFDLKSWKGKHHAVIVFNILTKWHQEHYFHLARTAFHSDADQW